VARSEREDIWGGGGVAREGRGGGPVTEARAGSCGGCVAERLAEKEPSEHGTAVVTHESGRSALGTTWGRGRRWSWSSGVCLQKQRGGGGN